MRATPLMLAIALGLGLPAATEAASRQPASSKAEEQGLRTYIVVFEEPAAGRFRGFEPTDTRRPKLAATSPAATGARKYDARSMEAVAYVDYLQDLREMRLGEASRRLGRALEPIYTYHHAMNGMAVALTSAEAAELARMPGVKSIGPDFVRQLQTTHGPQWINADDVWSGAATGSPHRGAGVVVGVIDSGIRRTHVAFAGGGLSNPLGGFRGYCTTAPAACNNKLVGLWDFTGGNNSGLADPVDSDGHGTHVAATAAGNAFNYNGNNLTGVAPDANIIAYKGCADECDGSALIRAIDQAVADGVDVINYSIGGGVRDPWETLDTAGHDDAEAYLGAREAGIVVAVAAGNTNEGVAPPGSLNSPSNSPWVLSVANASHNRNGNNNADRLAASSNRGPVYPFNVVKPDITAPGTQIISASNAGDTISTVKSGTSMATPHVAGAAALLRSINPSYSADQVISALQLTARPSVKTNAVQFADPHEQGSGMADVAKAARAGLYLEVPPNGFRAVDGDTLDGGAQNLNLPSLANANCVFQCSFTRTFKLMPGAAAGNYTIQTEITAGARLTPSVAGFTGSAAGTAVTFTLDIDDTDLIGDWIYGSVTLVNASGDGRPNLRLPVAVFVSPYTDFDAIIGGLSIDATLERGFGDASLGSLWPLPNARFVTTDLVEPDVETRNVPLDPTENDPYDNVQSNYSRTFTIPPSGGGGPVTYKLRVTTSAASPDIDLFVGRDNNVNGRPDAAEELCRSTTPGSEEVCELELTSSGSAQTLWLMVQNYSGPGTNVEISQALVPMTAGSNGSLVATGPGNVPMGADFKVRLAYDDATMIAGERRVGYLMIQSEPGSTVLEVPVTIDRTGAGFAPYALSDGAARSVTLPAGAAHDTLVFDVPANATSVTFRTTGGSGSVSLYAARVDTPAGPTIAPAPARDAAGVLSSTAAGANQSITAAAGTLQPGRWYVTPVNTGGAATSVDVSATVDSVVSPLVVKPGSYYAPARGGHGVFMYPAGAERAVLWYTYFQDQSPTWYYMQAPAPGNTGSWTTPIYRAAWNGTANHLVPVGNVVMTAATDNSFTMAYNVDGFTGIEKMEAFLTGCPTVGGTPLDSSGNWFDPARAGSGYSVQVHPNYEFIAAFIYDSLGVPRFLTAERGGAFAAGDTTIQLDQLRGFSPLGAYSAPVRTAVGSVVRQYAGGAIDSITLDATFGNGVAGTWDVTDNVVPLGETQGCAP